MSSWTRCWVAVRRGHGRCAASDALPAGDRRGRCGSGEPCPLSRPPSPRSSPASAADDVARPPSLGRLESRVLPTLDAAPRRARGDDRPPVPPPPPTEAAFFAGELRLKQATDILFGAPPAHRRSRIMVTLRARPPPTPISSPTSHGAGWTSPGSIAPTTATSVAGDGGQCPRHRRPVRARPYRAHGDRRPEDPYRGYRPADEKAKFQPGDTLRLIALGTPRGTAEICFSAPSRSRRWSGRCLPGDRLRYDDGKLKGSSRAPRTARRSFGSTGPGRAASS